MTRLVVVPALLAPLFLAGLPSAGAQVPLEETVDEVVQTTEEVVQTTEEVVQTTGGVVQSSPLTQAAEEVTQSTSGTAKETAGSATGGGDGAASGTADGGATSVATGGGTSGSSAGKNPNGAGKVRGSADNKSARGAVRKPMPQPGDVRGVAPAPALMVAKTNDADGDFTFTSAEIAPQPGADVPFEVSLLNQAAGEVTIGEILDYFPRGGGVEEVRVCNEVSGRILAPGGSVTCAFTLEAYSTEKGGRVINTIRVQGTVNHNGTNVSASDASSVATTGERVLGIAIAQPPGSLAETGAAIIRLLRLATLLALMGMLCVAASAPWERRVQARVDAAAQSIRFGLASPPSPRGL